MSVFIVPELYHQQTEVVKLDTAFKLTVKNSINISGYTHVNHDYAIPTALDRENISITEYLSSGDVLLKNGGSYTIFLLKENDTLAFTMIPFME